MAKNKVKYSDMTVEKSMPSGGYRISHFQDGFLNSRLYLGYSKREAMKRHKDEFEKGK